MFILFCFYNPDCEHLKWVKNVKARHENAFTWFYVAFVSYVKEKKFECKCFELRQDLYFEALDSILYDLTSSITVSVKCWLCPWLALKLQQTWLMNFRPSEATEVPEASYTLKFILAENGDKCQCCDLL